MATNVLSITQAHDKARLSLHGDMSVLFDTEVSANFSIRLFTTTTELFTLDSNIFQFRDTSGNLVSGLIFEGKPGQFVDLMFDPEAGIWYVTANNLVAGDGEGGGGNTYNDEQERELVFNALPSLTPFDRALGRNWYATITANAKLANPSNMQPGQSMRIVITQGIGGSKVLQFDGAYGFFEAQPGVLSTAAGAKDIFEAFMTNGYELMCDLKKNYSVIRPLVYAMDTFHFNMNTAYAAAQTSSTDGQTVQVIRNGYRTECNGTVGFGLGGSFNMRIRGVNLANGKAPELRLTKEDRPSFGKALINIEGGDNIVVENLVVAGASAYTDGNGTGILVNGGVNYVRVQNVHLLDNENGVRSGISNHPKFDLIDCLIEKNGQAANPIHRGYSHSIYAGECAIWRGTRVTFRDPVDGHNIKTRALRTVLNQVYSRNAAMAREVDCPDQAVFHATNCVFWKNAGGAQNNLIGIGHELLNGSTREQQYVFRNCYFHNDLDPQRDVTFLENFSKGVVNTVPVHFIDCEFGGAGLNKGTQLGKESLMKGPYTITLTGGPLGPILPVGDSRALWDGTKAANRTTNPAGIPTTPIGDLPPLIVTEPTPPYPEVFFQPPVIPPLPVNTGNNGDSIAPTVTINASSTLITQPGVLNLTATAADAVGVSSVEFYRNGTLISTDTSTPYGAIENISATDNGTIVYTAKAFDATGNNRTSTPVNVVVNIPDTTKPLVTLAASSTNVTVPSNLVLTATATDNVAVVNVEFYRGGTLISSDNSNPYNATQPLTYLDNGTLVYTVKAYDQADNVSNVAQVTVVVNIPPPDVTNPTVSLASTSTSVTADGSVTLTATASDNVGVASVEFYRNGLMIGTADTSAPYTMAQSFTALDNGTIVYTAKAFDLAGNSMESTAVNVVVAISGDGTAPEISLAASATDIVTPQGILLTATATDAIGVTEVEFYRNGVLIGTADTTAPYTMAQTFTEADNGTIVYTAEAYDAALNSTVSNSVTVTVNIPHAQPTTTLDSASQTEYDSAVTAATAPNKRMAGANAIVSAMSPDHRLYIYQDGVLIQKVEYTGPMTAVDDGYDVYVQPSTTMDSADVLVAGDLTVGTWWFELQGGSSYGRVIHGSVGNATSGADLTLSENPAIDQGFDASVKLILPRSLDGLA